MGTEPIHFAALASLLTLMLTLCLNSLIYHWKTHRRFDTDANANALCERAITVRTQISTEKVKLPK